MHVLAARPVAELQAYEQYSQQHGLPLWRIELQLASIAMRLDAQRAPGVPLQLSDYLIRPQPAPSQPPAQQPPAQQPTAQQPQADEPPTEAQAQAAAEALGFRPQNRRKPKPSQPQPSPAP